MSRIGRNPVVIPNGVSIDKINEEDRVKVVVKGGLGELSYKLLDGITISVEDTLLKVQRKDDSKEQKAYHGLTRALIQNMVTGVNSGFEKVLEIVGTGYTAERVGPWLKLILGYSHEILMTVPDDLAVETETVPRAKAGRSNVQTIIKVKGISKEDVGKFSAEIRKCRPPENYKGKGIRYQNEIVKIKAGKSGAK